MKYWAVNDEMLLSDVKKTAGPEDPFKFNRVQKPTPKEIPPKVNHCEEGLWNTTELPGVINL